MSIIQDRTGQQTQSSVQAHHPGLSDRELISARRRLSEGDSDLSIGAHENEKEGFGGKVKLGGSDRGKECGEG